MDIRPIRSEEDYREALRLAESCMDAGAHTPEGDMLDILATLIEDYERKACPLDGSGRGHQILHGAERTYGEGPCAPDRPEEPRP